MRKLSKKGAPEHDLHDDSHREENGGNSRSGTSLLDSDFIRQQRMMELFQREKEEAERELAVARKELEIARRELDIQRCQNVREGTSSILRSNHTSEQVSQPTIPRVGITVIADLLAPYEGKSEKYDTWERQLRLLKATYRLDEEMSKVIVGMHLKGRAQEWLHSKPDLIGRDLDTLLEELKAMFQSTQSKIICRRNFESRVWRRGETFRDYIHDKIILGNRIPIPNDEMLEYVVEGIGDESLRDQARIQQFNSLDALTRAFEKITLKSKGVTMNTNPGKISEASGLSEKSIEWGKNDMKMFGTTKRCYNCGARHHLSMQCPSKSKGAKCCECQEYGHIAANCKMKLSLSRNSCAVVSSSQRKHPIKVCIDGHAVKALIDIGSDICILRADEYIRISAPRLHSRKIRFEGVGSSANETIGEFRTNIVVDGNTYPITISVVSDTITRHKLLIGVDFLDKINLNVKAGKITISPLEAETLNGWEEFRTMSVNMCCVKINLVDTSHIMDSDVRKEIEILVENYKPDKKVDVPVEMKLILKDDEPVYEPPRRLSQVEKVALSGQIVKWLENDIIQPYESDYGSRVVLVPKKYLTYRVCPDYRRVNKKIVKDRYPLPVIEDQLDQLQSAKYYTTLDL